MIGWKIKKTRELRGYSQEYLANQLGISQKTYSNIETNQAKVDYNRLEEISKILKISLVELLSFDEKNALNFFNGNTSFEYERKAYQKHIEQLEKENEFLRQQLDKFIK